MLNFKVHLAAENIDKDFYRKIPEKYPIHFSAMQPKVKYGKLNELQKKLVDEFKSHINQSTSEILNNQKLVIINGQGGSGKSETGRHMRLLLERRKLQGSPFDFKVMEFSGIASTQLYGTTMHNVLKIPSYIEPIGLASYLEKPMNEKLRKSLQKVSVLLIDEYSLIGARMLYFLSEIMKRADETRCDQPFAGRTVYLLGDFGQLPAVKDRCLIAEDFHNSVDEHVLISARALFHRFTSVYIMETQFRQNASDQAEFRGFLQRMRWGKCTEKDEVLLQSRMRKNLTPEEASSFNDALTVYQTVAEVEEHNRRELYTHFKQEDIRTVPNGPSDFTYAVGCKVGLTRNLSTAYNLVNGSIGTIAAVFHDEKSKKIKFILVDFTNYRGPVLVTATVNGQKVYGMPVFPMRQECMHKGRIKSFTAIPLCLRYAITSYRVQSLTLDKVAIKFSYRQLFSGSDYTVCSRAKRLSGLLVEDNELALGRIRYNTIRDFNFFKMNENEEKRLRQLSEQTLLLNF